MSLAQGKADFPKRRIPTYLGPPSFRSLTDQDSLQWGNLLLCGSLNRLERMSWKLIGPMLPSFLFVGALKWAFSL
uniref:Uncharacterized protein n=1 Tax=Cucumis melo TaxID=3656 RepID=A0A9I9EHS6_CUCME